MKYILILLSFLFVLFSFTPSFYDIYYSQYKKNISPTRDYVLEHNYMFDYNFYLSRIRQGQEGKWLVREKYYNKEHDGSFFQILYLYLGKISSPFGVSPQNTYHAARLVFGFTSLILVAYISLKFFKGIWSLVSYLLIVMAGSWPIPVKLSTGVWRSATYMGWWSVTDSLQRITFLPHVVFGQIILVLLILRYNREFGKKDYLKWILWGLLALAIGIIFPPTLVIVYVTVVVLSFLEFIFMLKKNFRSTVSSKPFNNWAGQKLIPRIVMIIVSFPSFLYLQAMFKIQPWKALALFDIQHRMGLPYREFALALGVVLPLGILGFVITVIKGKKKFLPFLSWILSIVILILLFENVPQQSPLRFTQGLVHLPLGILSVVFIKFIWEKSKKIKKIFGKLIRGLIVTGFISIIIMNLLVMISMIYWLTDQVIAKAYGTFPVPIGAQLVYPLKDFMKGVYFIRDNTKEKDIVMGYVTAGNFIPAYAGNYVYLGHANTPDEDQKEGIAAKFFRGEMIAESAEDFLKKEKISYIFYGPQERELGYIEDISVNYPFLKEVYRNEKVVIYKVSGR